MVIPYQGRYSKSHFINEQFQSNLDTKDQRKFLFQLLANHTILLTACIMVYPKKISRSKYWRGASISMPRGTLRLDFGVGLTLTVQVHGNLIHTLKLY